MNAAASYGYVDVCQLLLDYGANIETADHPDSVSSNTVFILNFLKIDYS